ncbi:MAG: hypothetical protein FWH29_03285 [Methanobrevibacter sp.]|nr:hypothetical protein [Methanobrevibacter sp.]
MNKKFFALITILIAMLSILVGLYESAVSVPKTDFDTNFMSGTIYGDAILNKSHDKNNNWWVSYEDQTNNISYKLFILKNSTLLMEIFKYSGFQKVESKTYNTVTWDIYFLKTQISSEDISAENSTIFGLPNFFYFYLCTTNQNGVDYFIFLFSPKSTGASNPLNSDLYGNHVEPLLKTIKIKNVDYSPSFQELFKTTR